MSAYDQFAVPWAALPLDTANKRFTLGVPKEVLKDAPVSTRSAGRRCRTILGHGVHQFYGTPFEAD